MYTNIYQNSYVILVIAFIIISAICYIFEIGYNTKISDNKIIKSFSWKYPLAISLIIWVFWHFYLYPPTYSPNSEISATSNDYHSPSGGDLLKTNKLMTQRINMANWN